MVVSIRFIVLMALFCVVFTQNHAAQGQETVSNQELKELLFPSEPAPSETDLLAPPETLDDDALYALIPDEYIEEAVAYTEECENNFIKSQYYDCRCMGAEYLDQRITLGPDAEPSDIERPIGPKCADGAGIAGEFYQSCADNFLTVPVGVDIDEYCACYGNTYAKLFEGYGRDLRQRAHINMMVRARLSCRNPRLVERFFGR